MGRVMAMHDTEESRTVRGIILGIAVYFAIVTIPVMILAKGDRFRWEIGLLAGCILAVLMTVNMYMVISRSLDGKKHSSAYLALWSVGRMLIIAAVLALFAYTGWLNAIAVLIGVFGLKISAHMQPLFIKFFKNKE